MNNINNEINIYNNLIGTGTGTGTIYDKDIVTNNTKTNSTALDTNTSTSISTSKDKMNSFARRRANGKAITVENGVDKYGIVLAF
jgi:hypothetical protein